MSQGPGAIERKILELFAQNHNRALDVDEIIACVFETSTPTLAMRHSAIRAAHRLIRRLDETNARAEKLRDEAWRRVDAILREIEAPDTRRFDDKAMRLIDAAAANYRERLALLKATPQWPKAERLFDGLRRIGQKNRMYRKPGDRDSIYAERETWRATLLGKGRGARLMFHMPDVPVEAFAVTIDRSGVHWFPAEVVRVTEHNVMVRYDGGIARLDREQLWKAWAFWRGVRFVSSRSGRIADKLDEIWRKRYASPRR